MMSKAKTVKQYLAELSPDRRQAIQAVREVILNNLDKDYEEGMQYGMISYFVPHRVYPAGYHCDPKQPLPFTCLASQKNYMSLYMMCVYGSHEHAKWFQAELAKTGKKLDMGKSCIRFKKLDDLPLELIGKAIARVPARTFIAFYESAIKNAGGKRKAASGKNKATTAKKKSARRTKKAGGKKRKKAKSLA